MNDYVISLNNYFNDSQSTNVHIMYDFLLPKQNNKEEYFVKIILEIKR